jgi:murein DD-endopeptidase MepM/ murein hydrolase activator NlpD
MMITKTYNRKTPMLFGILMTAALLAASMPQAVLAAPQPAVSVTCSKYHNVESGDTLSAISLTYDVSVAELAAANDLKEPYTLIIGQRLCIPGSATSSSSSSTSTTTSSDKPVIAVERDDKFLVITIANFPKKGNYYVKIKKGHQGTDTPWYKLGILRTKKNNTVSRAFKLPSNFYDPALTTVCLKNAKTDAISCVPVKK